MSEQAKNMPVLSENAESSGAPAQPTLSDNAESSCAPAPLTPLEMYNLACLSHSTLVGYADEFDCIFLGVFSIRLNMAGLERAYGKEEYMDDEEDDDEEEDDEQLGERLKRKFLHCETCVATSLIPRFCKVLLPTFGDQLKWL
jgi:hypothetical protein